MSINYDKLMSLHIPEVVQPYTEKDAILYALGVGLGRDPMDEDELPFVYEKSLKVLPTFAAVLGWPGFWLRDLDTGVDWVKLVAGEQALVLHRPLLGRGAAIGRTRVTEIIDKGAGVDAENEMLAGALSNVELGDEIPAELYKAVAEVLVFVLRLSGRIR